MKFGAIAASALGLMLASAANPVAAQTTYDPNRVIGSVTMDDLKAIGEANGDETIRLDREAKSLYLRSSSGVIYGLSLKACPKNTPDRCQGVLVSARFVYEGVTQGSISEANDKLAAMKATMPEEGKYQLSRYVILDDGITMANLRSNVSVFVSYPFHAAVYPRRELMFPDRARLRMIA